MGAAYDRGWAITAAGQARGSGAWKRARCLACAARTGKEDRRGSFGFNPSLGAWNCFKCAFSGRFRADELERLGHERDEQAPEVRAVMEPPEGFIELTSHTAQTSASMAPAYAYLESRGIPWDVVVAAQLGACVTGKYGGRVVVPILAPLTREWMGFSSRVWFKKHPIPYLYPAGMDREHVMYNHEVLLTPGDDPVYVVEGVFDVLALWPNAVAVLGKPSEAQIEALAMSKRPVVVVLDGDAWEEGWSLAMRLRFDGARAGFVKLPPRLDPDEVDRGWLDHEARKSLVTEL